MSYAAFRGGPSLMSLQAQALSFFRQLQRRCRFQRRLCGHPQRRRRHVASGPAFNLGSGTSLILGASIGVTFTGGIASASTKEPTQT